jgi:hypothetical protein
LPPRRGLRGLPPPKGESPGGQRGESERETPGDIPLLLLLQVLLLVLVTHLLHTGTPFGAPEPPIPEVPSGPFSGPEGKIPTLEGGERGDRGVTLETPRLQRGTFG